MFNLRMRHILPLTVVFSLVGGGVSSARAAELWCEGWVDRVITYKTGEISIWSSWRQDWTHVCNVDASWKEVTTQVCWGWFAQLNQAVNERLYVVAWYGDLPDGSTCANLPTYHGAPSPLYVLVRRQA